MKRDWIRTRWVQLLAPMAQRWESLTTTDFEIIAGDWDLLVTRLQDLYHAEKFQVEKEIDRFLETIEE
jgi:hypothetical protein